jgi:transcriptional regulator with XRE-family HTH domain
MNGDMKAAQLEQATTGDRGNLQSLRARLRLTQRAFGQLAGITQSELSRLETGKVERPQRRTIEAYIRHCQVSEEDFQHALLTTIRQFSDPSVRQTWELDGRIRELFPRQTEGQQIDVAGPLIGLGRRLHQVAGNEDVRWFRLASTAEACLFGLREATEDVAASHVDVIEGALLGVMHMCASERGPQAAVDPATFRGILINALGRREESAAFTAVLRSLFSLVLPVARRYPEGFLLAEEAFDDQWAGLQLDAVDSHHLPTGYGRLVAASHLLAGVADDVRPQNERAALRPDDSVAAR